MANGTAQPHVKRIRFVQEKMAKMEKCRSTVARLIRVYDRTE